MAGGAGWLFFFLQFKKKQKNPQCSAPPRSVAMKHRHALIHYGRSLVYSLFFLDEPSN
jgi:hypothetical protein